jgi:S-adenosylmethionine:tRNA ribosyltransferase-isomerase
VVEVAAHGRPVAPALNEAAGPVELLEPGRERDAVRLLVSSADDGAVSHREFVDLPDLLDAGDVVVVNDSAVIPAALPAELHGEELRLHVSSAVGGTARRLIELRIPEGLGSAPFTAAAAGHVVRLPADASATLVAPRLRSGKPSRLWEAELSLPGELYSYLKVHGEPIRYGYVSRPWPLDAYQTIFARVPGSSEMPSAGRPFSRRVVERLREKGVIVASITLHAGVSSLERDEQPSPEPFSVPRATAEAVNTAHASGRRVIAVGTTVIRALESTVDRAGSVEPAEGVTGLVVEACREIQSVSGLLTGFHEREASHLKLLDAVAGADAVAQAYTAAVDEGYAWHEFGDVHLLMAPRA